MLLPVRSVGVMGDGRTHDHVVALRAVTATDGMTADSYPFDHSFLTRVASRIIVLADPYPGLAAIRKRRRKANRVRPSGRAS